MPQKRVLVVANKWWECDPIMYVLLRDSAHTSSVLGWPELPGHPHRRPERKEQPVQPSSPVPRAVFTLSKIKVEVWCISDLLEHLPEESSYQSSAQRKIERLPEIFSRAPVDFVIAIGTAAYPGDGNENGSVTVGTRIFMHDANQEGKNHDSEWRCGPFDELKASSLDRTAFIDITSFDPRVVADFLVPPLNPAKKGRLLVDDRYVALGTVNVTYVGEYVRADQATLDAYLTKYERGGAKSLETTHGLIRVQSEAPFIFVSGIANRMGHFDDDVGPRCYAQNTSAAHNAGIVLANIIPRINGLF